MRPATYADARACAEDALRKLGNKIVLGLPLGLGKANHLANALFDLARETPSIDLTIFTALTLEVPHPKPGLEARLAKPILERLYVGYPELHYAQARRRGRMPDNVKVREFFLETGALLTNDYAQREYVSANYTHAARAVFDAGVNVVAQMVGRRKAEQGDRLSLSSNPDLALDLVTALRAIPGRQVQILGEINDSMPFMPNDAEIGPEWFDGLYEAAPYTLFSLPPPQVSLQDHAIGLNTAALVKDGGTLQLGIGSLADAVAHALILREKNNTAFHDAVAQLESTFGAHPMPARDRGYGPFVQGLYGCSEMISDGVLALLKTGIIRRSVTDEGEPGNGTSGPRALDGAFFLGSRAFYQALRELDERTLSLINMTSVAKVNGLYRDEALRRRQRTDARFINSIMEATALGGAASDALADGRIVSGVGGQYNFVAMAHELDGARSILMVRSTKLLHGKLHSNIVWQRPNETIPRHLKDIIVSEYGAVDLRGQTDGETIKRMLSICDSRFQDGILEAAKRARKIERSYRIPDEQRGNTPERLKAALEPAKAGGALPDYPFGSDLTEVETVLAGALKTLQARTRSWRGLAGLVPELIAASTAPAGAKPYLERLDLAAPRSLQDRLQQRLVIAALHGAGVLAKTARPGSAGMS